MGHTHDHEHGHTHVHEAPKIVEYFLLDMTGSMQPNASTTISAMSEYINSMKSSPATKNDEFNLFVFNSEVGVSRRSNRTRVADLTAMNRSEYSPNGLTPLYDAMGEVIRIAERETAGTSNKVIFVVQTDGQENSSKEWTRKGVMDLVTLKQEYNKWQFVYLGADLDAMDEGAKVSIVKGNTLSYEGHDLQGAMDEHLISRTAYSLSGGQASNNFFSSGGGTAADKDSS